MHKIGIHPTYAPLRHWTLSSVSGKRTALAPIIYMKSSSEDSCPFGPWSLSFLGQCFCCILLDIGWSWPHPIILSTSWCMLELISWIDQEAFDGCSLGNPGKWALKQAKTTTTTLVLPHPDQIKRSKEIYRCKGLWSWASTSPTLQ